MSLHPRASRIQDMSNEVSFFYPVKHESVRILLFFQVSLRVLCNFSEQINHSVCQIV